MISIRITPNYRVDCKAAIELGEPVSVIWRRLLPWNIASTWDPFHWRILQLDGPNQLGGRIILDHRYGPICITRVGRLMRFNEEEGFAFSDLSTRDAQQSFPHSYSYDLEETATGGTRVVIRVRGRWTLRIGRTLVWLWLWWVMIQLRQQVRNNLIRSQRSGPAPETCA